MRHFKHIDYIRYIHHFHETEYEDITRARLEIYIVQKT